MNGPATFGDFAETARRHLAALPAVGERPNPDIVARQIRGYNYGLHRILKVMIRYTADLAETAQPVDGQSPGSPDWWARAVADTRRALHDALLHSPVHLAERRGQPVSPADEPAGPADGRMRRRR